MEHVKQGKNLSDVQEINRSLVLNTLRENPNCSRSYIAKATGLRQTTITKIINDFINWGIVIETSLLRNARGRRAIGLQLNSDHYRVIGLRLQRTNILLGLYDISGREYKIISQKIEPSQGAEAAISTMIQAIHLLQKEAEGNILLGIGVGLPGPYLKNEGSITVMADFPGWEDYDIKTRLEQEFGKLIFTEHDAHANGYAEWWFGHQRHNESVLLSISMEEGLGAALVIDGKIYYGKQGVAGEIGHLSIDYNGIPCPCGSRGCLRNYCSDTAVVRQAMIQRAKYAESSLNQIESLNLPQIIQAAQKGDKFAVNLLINAATHLGYGLVSIIYLYNPGLIVLSRQFASAGKPFLNAIRKVLEQRLPSAIASNVTITFSKITADPVLMGMVALVTDAAFKNPSGFIEMKHKNLPSGIPTT